MTVSGRGQSRIAWPVQDLHPEADSLQDVTDSRGAPATTRAWGLLMQPVAPI
jgi:hypothetical protein